jgi:hypothetical protein
VGAPIRLGALEGGEGCVWPARVVGYEGWGRQLSLHMLVFYQVILNFFRLFVFKFLNCILSFINVILIFFWLFVFKI